MSQGRTITLAPRSSSSSSSSSSFVGHLSQSLFFSLSVGRRGGIYTPAPPLSPRNPPPPPPPPLIQKLCKSSPSKLYYNSQYSPSHRQEDGRLNHFSMRKLLLSDGTNGTVSPTVLPQHSLISLLSPLLSPSPTPSPIYPEEAFHKRPIFLFPSIPISDVTFDLVTLSLVAGLLLLSLISLSFVLHLRLRSRRLCHLQHFNYLWTVRLLLVSLASLWALNELLRLPFFRREYLFPFLPSLTLNQQANLCKVHAVLSLGFFEPGFLVTLLFLVNVSIQKRLPRRMWALAISVCVSCSPILLLQAIFVFYSPFEAQLPKLMHGSSVLLTDFYGKKTVLCTYPFFSSVIFGAFAIAYSLAFLLSSWRVVVFVINKSITARINMLVSTLMITLPMQILCLSLSFLWSPEDISYCLVVLAMFLCVAWFLAVGEVILVIKPINEALAAGGAFTERRPGIRFNDDR